MDEVVSIKEQAEIIDWANNNYIRFIPNGYGRQYKLLQDLPDIPQCVWEIKKRVIEIEKLYDYIQEPTYKDFIGYITDGGQIHPHKDRNFQDLIHTRFNVFIQLPEEGGMPIYNHKRIQVYERTYCICHAGAYTHFCEKVKGKKARIVLSFGFLVPFTKYSPELENTP